MQLMWLYTVGQCVLSLGVIGMSVRLCVSGVRGEGNSRGASVSTCLRLCLGWVGAVGNAVSVPIYILLNLRSAQCLYTCIILVSCPLLVRQFKMFLLLLLTLHVHLQHRLGNRYAAVVTRRRILCLVLLTWLASVLTAFAQYISWNAQDTWITSGGGGGTAGLGLDEEGNWTTPPPKHPGPQDRSVIGQYLPYGGFLSKFLVADLHNFTYAEIHSNHWGVCAPDLVFSPEFMVYVYGVTVFLLPLIVLLTIYLDLMCIMSKAAPGSLEPLKRSSPQSQSLALSLLLLVLLGLPCHISHALLLFAPGNPQPLWVTSLVTLLFQAYGLVPPILFMQTSNSAPLSRLDTEVSPSH
ncbi:uncharacterized protein LOC114789931 [Denticeps clupeoides]|uniref:uncharacterized protein LOC114789931 n=1 Tax=Denticeps clupeoides TaxID=299321 RepID=UPI0010A5933F|nr:uncharacterized protein LOC114789931 [Denticeps clupeoides]